MSRQTLAVTLAAALLLAGCFSLEPEVVKSQGQSQAPAPAQRAYSLPKPPAPLAPPRMGQWSDDGLRYQESEETSGVPLLPFSLFRRRTTSTPPRAYEAPP